MMFLRRDPVNRLFREVDWLNSALQQLGQRSEPTNGLRGSLPPINMWEDEHALFAELDLPGFPADKIDVSVTEGNQLTIAAERPVMELEGAVWHRQERGFGQFTRSLTLPTLVDADRVEANFQDGVLRLTLPKAEAAKPRKITVKAN